MKENYVKWISIGVYASMGISALFTLLYFISFATNKSDVLGPIQADEESFFGTGIYLIWAYILFFISLIVVLYSIIKNFIVNPSKSKTSAMYAVVLVIIMIISYLISSGDNTGDIAVKFEMTSTGMKSVGMGIIVSYLLGFAAILAMIYSEVKNSFK